MLYPGLLLTCLVLTTAQEGTAMSYDNTLERIENPPPLLADHPEFVEPLVCDTRFLARPVVSDAGGKLLGRSWRYWYNARGIVEMENRLDGAATAIVNVHPWGVDDGHGVRTPEPAGCAFFCTHEKNQISLKHVQEVLNPFLRRLRKSVAAVAHSLPGKEDDIRKLLYPSISTRPEDLDAERGERLLAELLAKHPFTGEALAKKLTLDSATPLKSYFEQTPSTDAGDRYNGPGFWQLPMPIVRVLDRGRNDIVAYDAEGYPKVRDYLKGMGVRHILLTGYATDMCVARTTCGYENLSKDFNVFLVGDATLATFPGSTTPKYATQVALANAALSQMVTQVGWVRTAADGER